MHCVVFENLGATISVPDNANLREVCLREGLKLYFGLYPWLNCRGRARCGSCEVEILEGAANLSPPSPFEKRRLPEAGSVRRLACQTHVRGPLRLNTRPPRGRHPHTP